MRISIFLFSIIMMTTSCAQLPYESIPEYPENYSSGNVISRMIDGLGYRYYWATEGLTETDLKYKPSPEGRDVEHTLEHIHGLSKTILNGAKNEANVGSKEKKHFHFKDMRGETLKNFRAASKLMAGKTEAEVADLKIVFQRGEKKSEFPFWHMFNGPIADAMWHTGQVVSFRRSSGNPLNPKVNVFMGHTKH